MNLRLAALMTISDGAMRKNFWSAVELQLQMKLQANGTIAAKAADNVCHALRRASNAAFEAISYGAATRPRVFR